MFYNMKKNNTRIFKLLHLAAITILGITILRYIQITQVLKVTRKNPTTKTTSTNHLPK